MKKLITLWAVGVAGLALAASPQDPRPNFVFIIGDDISAEDFGCYGNAGIRTPNIDRLAAQG
ncbi:MAG: sulfatase-like hydrolase/transferase, partial [Opitutaceae bacterium]